MTRTFQWVARSSDYGFNPVVFEATDGTNVVRSTVTIDVHGGTIFSTRTGIRIGDVTGDGRLDVVANAAYADQPGATDAGLLFVWAGSAVPAGLPTAVLKVPGARTNDRLGIIGISNNDETGVQLADVTGDGVLDVVAGGGFLRTATTLGGVVVWRGGPMSGDVIPTATLTVADGASTGLCTGVGSGIRVLDLTGDGIQDVVVTSPTADNRKLGAIYVWAGGATLLGAPAPLATMTVAGAATNDLLAASNLDPVGQGVLFADVVGDAAPDVVALAQVADHGGIQDRGAVYVWPGGASLVGSVSAVASLVTSEAGTNDRLGLGNGLGFQLGDVTGDGRADIVTCTPDADVGGVLNAGAVHVWAGTNALAGTLLPTATLSLPGAQANDRFGTSIAGLLLTDVTGDGVLDVVASGFQVTVGGVAFAGAVAVWAGGAGLTGAPSPRATLTNPAPVDRDLFGALGSSRATLVGDVTGDGLLDLVVGADRADIGGVVDAGAVWVWAGGSSLLGAPTPTARLIVPGAVTGDQENGELFLFDLDGDGSQEVVLRAGRADTTGVDHGAVYVWKGGATLAGGSVVPTSSLVPGSAAGNASSLPLGFGGVIFADITGGPGLDLVTTKGAQALVWSEVASLSGTLTPSAVLANGVPSARSFSLSVGDVSGDGRLDVVAVSPDDDVGAASSAGAVYVWQGGALSGAPPFSARVVRLDPASFDHLGDAIQGGPVLADLDGDGTLDVVVSSFEADIGAATNAGAIFFRAGGASLVGEVTPTTLSASPPVAGDELGR